MFRSSNPVFSGDRFNNQQILGEAPMTSAGAVNKAFILFAILAVSAAAVVYEAYMGYADKVMMTTVIGLIAGFILALIISFKPNTAPYLAPVYAFAEGACLGGISILLEVQFPGIAIQAIAGTFGALFVMLFLFKTKIIKVTEKFRSVLMISMVTILAMYLINFIMGFFGHSLPFITGSSPLSIGISAVIVVIAALSLLLDFDFIQRAEENLLPKHFEWYGAFGLMVTLVWLYIEILNLLAKLRDR